MMLPERSAVFFSNHPLSKYTTNITAERLNMAWVGFCLELTSTFL
jgi:hypothetical protein